MREREREEGRKRLTDKKEEGRVMQRTRGRKVHRAG